MTTKPSIVFSESGRKETLSSIDSWQSEQSKRRSTADRSTKKAWVSLQSTIRATQSNKISINISRARISLSFSLTTLMPPSVKPWSSFWRGTVSQSSSLPPMTPILNGFVKMKWCTESPWIQISTRITRASSKLKSLKSSCRFTRNPRLYSLLLYIHSHCLRSDWWDMTNVSMSRKVLQRTKTNIWQQHPSRSNFTRLWDQVPSNLWVLWNRLKERPTLRSKRQCNQIFLCLWVPPVLRDSSSIASRYSPRYPSYPVMTTRCSSEASHHQATRSRSTRRTRNPISASRARTMIYKEGLPPLTKIELKLKVNH